MTDYTRSTGSSATMMIRDTGSTVEFWINSNNGTTWTDHLPWSGTVNGVGVGGSYYYHPGSAWQRLGVWGVTSSQNVTFNIGNTGTSGFGGPTTLGPIFINRATVPPAPSPVTVFSPTATSLNVTYSSNGDGGSPVTTWQLGYGTNPAGPTEFVSVVTATITGLTPGTTYYFWARGANAVGVGPWSSRTQGTTLRIPDAPSTPRFSNIQQTTVHVDWDPNFDGGSPLVLNEIGWSTSNVLPPENSTPTGTSHDLTGLEPGTTYYVVVRTSNVVGWGGWSSVGVVRTVAGAWVKVGAEWKEAVPYVKDGGVWKLARVWARIAGEWKETQ